VSSLLRPDVSQVREQGRLLQPDVSQESSGHRNPGEGDRPWGEPQSSTESGSFWLAWSSLPKSMPQTSR
jgi:hypothetical protein